MPLELIWSPLARARLRQIRAYIARDQPGAAARLATRIAALAEVLRDHPHLGRIGGESGIRELAVAGTPYIIHYRIEHARITVTTIQHGMQLAD